MQKPENQELKDFKDKVEPEKKLTREQRRFQERVNADAQRVHSQLAEKFLNFVIEANDPEGEEVINKVKQVSAQWRLYCQRKNLVAKAYPMIDDYCDGVLKHFIALKEQPKQEPVESDFQG